MNINVFTETIQCGQLIDLMNMDSGDILNNNISILSGCNSKAV